MKVFIRTLGCEKNTVDSEYAAGLLEAAGIGITDDPASADVILVNTCGFIDDAKRESIDVLLGYAEGKKKRQKLFATGCLTQRYGERLRKAMPEIDGYIGVNDYAKLPEILLGGAKAAENAPAPKTFEELKAKRRQLSDTPWTAHIKIAEGCNNICTYCAIPFIRGKYRSRRPEDILKEARELAASGCRELVVIAQDTTAYGCDLGPGYSLAKLLKELCGIDGLRWIRLMYCYEDEITDELIEVIKTEPKVCKYIDIPIQHSSDRILKLMHRNSTGDSIRSTINKLRKQIPDIVIRTTLITGFPGEHKKEFKELYDFVAETRFDRLGVFAYSKEEGTAAARMPSQVKEDAKKRRRDRIMELQRGISLRSNMRYVGKILEALVEEDLGDGTYSGRTVMDAPEIDDGVIIGSRVKLVPGTFVRIKITDAFDYDLTGEFYEPAE